jgi:hypothetical protein
MPLPAGKVKETQLPPPPPSDQRCMEAELAIVRLRAENFRLTAAGMVSGGKAEQKLTNSDAMDSAMRQLQAVGAFIAEAQRLGLAPAPIAPAPAGAIQKI